MLPVHGKNEQAAYGPLFDLATQRLEESLELLTAGLFFYSAEDFGFVVHVLGDLGAVGGAAGFGVIRAENDGADAGVAEGGGAHGAGF